MGREVRRVPKDWKHPVKDGSGRFVPLFDGAKLATRTEEWDRESARWADGWRPDYCSSSSRHLPYAEWAGARPDPKDYMPAWPDSERTHYQMYEDTSEGTPISPVMESPEALARWLADNGASSFGSATATYGQWLAMINQGWMPSAVHTPETGLISGVEAAESLKEKP